MNLWHFCFSMRLKAATRRHHYQEMARKVFFNMWSSINDITPLFKNCLYCNTRRNQRWWIRTTCILSGKIIFKICNAKEVNEARRIPFSRDNKVIPPTNIPPTKRALRQHVFRSVLQSSKYRQSSYYKGVSRTTTTYKVENKMKNLLNTSFL